MPADTTDQPLPSAKPVRKRSGAVIIPGLLLVLVGLLNLLSALGFLAEGYYFLYANPVEVEAQMKAQSEDSPKQMRQAFGSMPDFMFWTAMGSFVVGVLTGILAFPVLFGGTGMLRSRGYYGAVFGALVALFSPGGFCLLGLIAGVWALVVLMNKNVRSTFR